MQANQDLDRIREFLRREAQARRVQIQGNDLAGFPVIDEERSE